MGLIKKLAFLFITLIAITTMPIQGRCGDCSKVEMVLKLIPKDDVSILREFFQLIFYHGDFSYTLFGTKPMCSIDYTMQYVRIFPENDRFCRETFLARKGLEVWKKYQHLFPMENIRFIAEESDQYEGHLAFTLINPKKCLPIIEKHLPLFQNYYGETLTSHELLKCLCRGTFFQKGKIDHTVLGLLLGYPEKDVHSFNNRLEKSSSSKNKSLLRPCHLALHKNPLTPIRAPYFMTDRKEEELRDIKSKYAAKKQELVKFYYSEDFLESLLNRFM